MFLSKEIDEKLIMAFDLYNKRLCESLPTDEELEHITFSDAFEKKMQKLIRAQKKSYYYLINTVGKRAAIIVLAIVISLTATTFGVKAIRESVIKFITETFEKFTAVSVEDEEPVVQNDIVKAVPQYIPEGYTLESEIDSGIFYRIVYSNIDNSYIDYAQKINFGTIYNVDTEDIEYEKLNIKNFEGIKYVKRGINTVIFADETYVYTVQGKISFEEVIKMAESIKIE